MNTVRNRVISTSWGTLLCLCTSSYTPWFICLNSRTCYSIYSEAPFSASQTTSTRFPLWEIRKGKCSYTYSLQQQVQHSRTINNLGTGKLRINWHLPYPLFFYKISSLLNFPESSFFFFLLLPTWSSKELCARHLSLPGTLRQSGGSIPAPTTLEPAVQQCLAPQAVPLQGGVPQPALTSTYFPPRITGTTAVNGIRQVCCKTVSHKGQIKIIIAIYNFHQVRLLAPSQDTTQKMAHILNLQQNVDKDWGQHKKTLFRKPQEKLHILA